LRPYNVNSILIQQRAVTAWIDVVV
jgi:hypothetical protein